MEGGIVPAATTQIRDILQQINELDPQYVFTLASQPDSSVTLTALPRYVGAEKDRPMSLKVTLAFPDTVKGESFHQGFRETLDYGTLSVIPPEFITEAFLDPPGTKLDGGELSLSSPAPDLVNQADIVLKAVGQWGETLARLPLEVEEATKGMRGSRIALKDKSATLTAVATYDGPTSHFKMDWSHTPPQEYWPHDLLPVAKLMAALGEGADMTVVSNGKKLGSQKPGQFEPSQAEKATRYAHLIEHLSNLQTKTGVSFKVKGDLTPEEEQAIVLASRLLDGNRVEDTWGEITLQIVPGGRESVEEALSGPPKAMRSTSHMSIDVQGETIPIGRLVEEIESAKVLTWDTSSESRPTEPTSVTLVPGDTDKMARFLSADPDA